MLPSYSEKKGKFNRFQIMLIIAFCCQVFCLPGVGAVLSGDSGMPLKEISSCTTLMHISTIGGEVAMHIAQKGGYRLPSVPKDTRINYSATENKRSLLAG